MSDLTVGTSPGPVEAPLDVLLLVHAAVAEHEVLDHLALRLENIQLVGLQGVASSKHVGMLIRAPRSRLHLGPGAVAPNILLQALEPVRVVDVVLRVLKEESNTETRTDAAIASHSSLGRPPAW